MAAGSKILDEIRGENDFVLQRVFDAPRGLVYKAWVEPKHMAQWWGPKNFTNPVCEMDVRAGGKFRIVMRGPDGVDYPFKGTFKEVAPASRLVWVGDCSEHPEAWHDAVNPGWDRSKGRPSLDLLTTITFEDVGNQTKVTVRMHFDSAERRDAMIRLGMSEGWSQSLDKLADELANVR